MSKSVNKVTILGHVGRDPEVKQLNGGSTVAKFSVACTDKFKGKDGQWQEKTEWVNVIAWSKLAEIVGKYVAKGDKVYVEGKLTTSSWEDKSTGKKTYRTEVTAQDLVLLGSKSGETRSSMPEATIADIGEATTPFGAEPIEEENIPF